MPNLAERIAAVQGEGSQGVGGAGPLDARIRKIQAEAPGEPPPLLPPSPTPPEVSPEPTPFYSFTEPNTVGQATGNLLHGLVAPFQEAAGFGMEAVRRGMGATPPAVGPSATTPPTVESETLQEPSVFLDPTNFLTGASYGAGTAARAGRPVMQAVKEAARTGVGFQTFGLSEIPGIAKGVGRGFLEGYREGRGGPLTRPPTSPPPTPLPVASLSPEERAREMANAFRGEAIDSQLAGAERLRQSPASSSLLKQDLARQQAEGQLRGLSGAASPMPVAPQASVVPPPTVKPVMPSRAVTPAVEGLQLKFKNPQIQSRFTNAASPAPKDYLAELGVTPADEANRDLLNRIIHLESRGNPKAVNLKTKSGKDSGLFQLDPKNVKRFGVTEQSPVEAQLRAAEQRLAELPREIGLDPNLSPQDRTRVLATAWLAPARTREALALAGKSPQLVPATLPTQPTTAVKQPWEMTVQRVEEQGVVGGGVEKPHGLYTSPADIESPHADLGGTKSTFETNPNAKVLSLPDMPPSDPSTIMRRDATGGSAGVVTAKQLLGSNEFDRLRSLSKSQLIQEAGKIDASVDWSRYFDRQEIMEGIGGVLARRAGYDAIWSPFARHPAFTEYIGLTDNAFIPRAKPVTPPIGQQPKLIQTQAELPPLPLQPKAPQASKKAEVPPTPAKLPTKLPQEPTRQGGLPLGESTVGAGRYTPPPFTAEQLRTGPGVLDETPLPKGLPPEMGQVRLKVFAKPEAEHIGQQLDQLFQGKLPNPDARFFRNVGAAVKRGDIVFPGQRELLSEHGIDHTQLGDEFLKAGTTWGQGLNMLSQWSKQVTKRAQHDPAFAEAMNIIPPPPKKVGWFRRLENLRASMITGTIRTAMRNAESGVAATFLDATEQAVANVATGAVKGNMAREVTAGVEQFSTALRAMSPRQAQEFLKVMEAFPLQKLELMSAPIQDVMLKGLGMEKVIGWAQFLNRTQENWVRAMAASASIRGEMVRRGISLTTASKDIPEDIITKGVADALRVTQAARPEKGTLPGRLASSVLEMYDAFPVLRLVNPFPRFQYANAFRFLWEHSPFGPLDLITKGRLAKETHVNMRTVKALGEKFARQHGKQPEGADLQELYRKATALTPNALKAKQELDNPKTTALALTKSAAGIGMLTAALAWRSSDNAPDKWYEIKVGGKTISGEAFGPFITFNLFAEGIRAAVAKHGTEKMKQDFNVYKKPPVVEPKDVARAVVGLNRVAGTGLVFIDLLEKGGGWPRVMDFFNQYVGSFTVPLSSVKNLMAGVRPKEAVIRDVSTAAPLTGPIRRNIPFVGSETLPSSPSITRGRARRMENPVSGELTGLTKKTYTPLEHEVNRLGLPWHELRPRTGIPEADLYLQRAMGTIMDRQEVEDMVTSPEFQHQPNPEKERRLRAYFSSARSAAMQELQANKPTLFKQAWTRKNQKKLDWLKSFTGQR